MLEGNRIKFNNSLIIFSLIFLPSFSQAEVIINEIMYNPVGSDSDREWIELYNNANEPVTIKGGTAGTDSWRIYQENSTGTINNRTFSTEAYQGDMTINAGEYLIVAKDGNLFKVDYPNFIGKILIVGAMSLTNNSLPQKIGLRLGSSGVPWSIVSYSSDQGANDDDNTLQLQTDGTWNASEPTPGMINSSSSSILPETASSTTSSVSNTSSTSNSQSYSGVSSAHYSSVPLSTNEAVIAHKVGAGRDRLGIVGSPLEFKGISNFERKERVNYTWSFGDGNIAYGEMVNHVYVYPGEYVVVLNAVAPNGRAVARVNVKIVPDSLSVSYASPERIEISNSGGSEVNLYGRKISVNGKVFIFPEDTIIRSGQKISFASSITGLSPLNKASVLMAAKNKDLIKDSLSSTQIAEREFNDKKLQIEDMYIKAKEIETALSVIPVDSQSRSISSETEDKVENLASAVVTLKPTSYSSTTKPFHRGWIQIIKEFFLGKK